MTIASHYFRRVRILLLVIFVLAVVLWAARMLLPWIDQRIAEHIESLKPHPLPASTVTTPPAPLPALAEQWPSLRDAIRAAAPLTMRLDEAAQDQGRVSIRGAVLLEQVGDGFAQIQEYMDALQHLEGLEALRLETFKVITGTIHEAPWNMTARMRLPGASEPRVAADLSAFQQKTMLVNMAMQHEIAVDEATPTVDAQHITLALKLSAQPEQAAQYLDHLSRVAPQCKGTPSTSSLEAGIILLTVACGLE